jgi:hypothetical protein
MMTNVIAFLHTTTAYQTAALQLMVGEANFAAKQLDLKEPLPIVVPADTNNWEVESPPMGLGGDITASNYFFEFQRGQLKAIHKRDWLKKISPPVQDLLELANRSSLLDTNSAYQLATQWLASISVDMSKLERTSPPVIYQVPARKHDAEGRNLPGVSNNVAVPLFLIGWGEETMNPRIRELLKSRHLDPNRPLPLRRPNPMSPVFVEILGTTKELISLDIRDASLLKRPALQITNADELLGPLPPPRHFVENLLGGAMAYEIVAHPDKVEAWLLTPDFDGDKEVPKADRTPAKKLALPDAKNFSNILTDFDSYAWGGGKSCIPDFGVRLRFTGGNDSVEFLLCYQCDILEVTCHGHTQEGNFDPSHNALAKAIQSAFPNDEAIKNLKTDENKN